MEKQYCIVRTFIYDIHLFLWFMILGLNQYMQLGKSLHTPVYVSLFLCLRNLKRCIVLWHKEVFALHCFNICTQKVEPLHRFSVGSSRSNSEIFDNKYGKTSRVSIIVCAKLKWVGTYISLFKLFVPQPTLVSNRDGCSLRYVSQIVQRCKILLHFKSLQTYWSLNWIQ